MSTFVLLDSRLSPQKNDIEFIRWLGEKKVPFCMVFTKADKLSTNELVKNVTVYKKEKVVEVIVNPSPVNSLEKNETKEVHWAKLEKRLKNLDERKNPVSFTGWIFHAN